MNVYLAALQLDITKKSTYVPKDIKKAFKKQAMKWHPDRNVGNEEKANAKMKEINEAYTSLLDILERQSSLEDNPVVNAAPTPRNASTKTPKQSSGATAPKQSSGATAPKQSSGATAPKQSSGATAPKQSSGATAPNKKPKANPPQKSNTNLKPMTAKQKEEYLKKKKKEIKERERLQKEELVRESIFENIQEKQRQQKKREKEKEREAFDASRQAQLDNLKQVEKDASFHQDMRHWTKKMEATFNNRHEIDFLLTVKLIYVDILRGNTDEFSARQLVTSTALEKISQIWYNYPGSVGNTKFVHNFASGYIGQCIAFSPSSAFFSKDVVMLYMQARAQDFLRMGQGLSSTNKQELSLILAILPYAS